MTEYQSRRELREAERQGLVVTPEQTFDLPTGSIKLPNAVETPAAAGQDIAAASEMLTRRRLREMERAGTLNPPTGAVTLPAVQPPAQPNVETNAPTFDEILAESEEPITRGINILSSSAPIEPVAAPSAPVGAPSEPMGTRSSSIMIPNAGIESTDIFHGMAVDLNARRPRKLFWIFGIVLVLTAAAAAAFMLGIFK